ncbi:MAG: SET domain-containing protein-lysine N-methyltransferase [Epsilonproteobacteria bacterium]|nr:MAG: SET domain-containing protein-lysine N-methyltransferase [Campylobacterota bacterium]
MLIYPYDIDEDVNYPTTEDFSIQNSKEGKGHGVYTHKTYQRGQFLANFTGYTVPNIIQHTLQITPKLHLYDAHFVGYLLHSCDPNVFIDMREFEVWALKDIAAGSPLTMDYAATEDVLFKQFKCVCDAPNCRHWVTGRKESVNDEGQLYLQQLNQ